MPAIWLRNPGCKRGQRPVVARNRSQSGRAGTTKTRGIRRFTKILCTKRGFVIFVLLRRFVVPGRRGRMRAEVVMRSRLVSVALILAGLFALAPLPFGALH